MPMLLRGWLILLCCLGSRAAHAADSDWNAVVANAKKEGKVVVYASTFGNATYKAVAKAFEAKYGVSVETLDIRASEVFERVRLEQQSDRFIGDIVMQPRSVITLVARAGLLQPHLELPNMANQRPSIGADELRVPLYSQLYGILVNASVKPEDEPKSWNDLLDPKWKGKLILDDPRAIGNGFSLFNATYKGISPEFQQKLSQQSPVVSRQVRNDERRVALGEYPIYAPMNFTYFAEMKGLPVRFVFPSEGSPNADTMGVVLKGAPHINAARLLLNFMLDPQAQLIYGNSGLLPTVKGVAEQLDANLQEMAKQKLLPQVDVDEMNDIMAKARELYK
jgi:iron(III) transport system substrate-binding protein